MPESVIHACACSACVAQDNHATQALHHQINLFLSRLDEQQRRWCAALKSMRIGRGDEQLVAQITGLSGKTIRRGRWRSGEGIPALALQYAPQLQSLLFGFSDHSALSLEAGVLHPSVASAWSRAASR